MYVKDKMVIRFLNDRIAGLEQASKERADNRDLIKMAFEAYEQFYRFETIQNESWMAFSAEEISANLEKIPQEQAFKILLFMASKEKDCRIFEIGVDGFCWVLRVIRNDLPFDIDAEVPER